MSRCSLIPRNVTASVGMEMGPYSRNYLLWRDSHTIFVQVPVTLESHNELPHIRAKANSDMLEVIQTIFDHKKFGVLNWAYVIPVSGGSYRIVYRHRTIYRFNCRTWAPLVDESEFEITKWITIDTQYAIWKGREVELFVAHDDAIASWVEDETRAREMLVGLDVSFEVLAHVLRDGAVVGLVLEPRRGRCLELRDRAIVYEAVARLQTHGLIFRDPHPINISNIAIADGKVRFLYPANIARFDTKDVEGLDKHQHWEALENLFQNLPPIPGGWVDYANYGQHCVLMPEPFYPERPLLGVRYIMVQIANHYLHDFDYSVFDSPKEVKKKKSGRRRDSVLCLIAPEADGAQQATRIEDRPLSLQELVDHYLHSSGQRKRITSSQRFSRRALLLADEDVNTSNPDDSAVQPSTSATN